MRLDLVFTFVSFCQSLHSVQGIDSHLGSYLETNQYSNDLGYSMESFEQGRGQERGRSSPPVYEGSAQVPDFDKTTITNVTALKDSIAHLHCIVKNIGNKTVSWIREKDLHILTVDKYTYTADNRFEVIHPLGSNSWTLKIKSVQSRDGGWYFCQVNTHPTKPITFPVLLNVFEPTATILGSTERFVDRGSTINLTCIIHHHPQPKTEIFWYHNNKVINYDSRESLVSVITDRGRMTKTILLIHDATNAASGTYSCVPSPSVSASVKIHILNGEKPAAMQTNSAVDLMTFEVHIYCQLILLVACLSKQLMLRIRV